MGIMGSLPDAGFSSLRVIARNEAIQKTAYSLDCFTSFAMTQSGDYSHSSAVSAWTFSIVNLWLTLPTTKKQNLSLNLVDAENERDTMFLPIFAP